MTARARSTDPHTSHEAAEMVNKAVSARLKLDILRTYAIKGALTDEALVDHLAIFTCYQPSGIRTRRKELQRAGYVAHCGLSKTQSGRKAILWTLTEDAERLVRP